MISGGRRSLVLITVDCLRADHVGFLGYENPTTPFLDSLAKRSAVFSNAIVAGAPTYYSFPAIMAARPPLALGRDVIGIAPHERTLATVLKDAGYATAAFLAGNPYLSRRFGYDSGFDTFRDHLDEELDVLPDDGSQQAPARRLGALNRRLAAFAHKAGPLGQAYDELYFQYCQRIASAPAGSLDRLRRFPAADIIVDEACEWLAEERSAPCFLWLHLMDAHSPYYPHEDALDSAIEGSQARYLNSYWNRGDLGPERLARHRGVIVDLYNAGVRWIDAQIRRLAEKLSALNLRETAVLAVTADHGEEFLDHGGRYHPPSNVYEELIRVPLLVSTPGETDARHIESPFSLVNLAPTLLDAIDVPRPKQLWGVSRWLNLRQGTGWDDAAVVECIASCENPFRVESRFGDRILAVRDKRFKLVLDFRSSREQLFDLEKDPKEMRPLSVDAEGSVRRRLLEIAKHHLQNSVRERDSGLRISARVRDLQMESARQASRVSA